MKARTILLLLSLVCAVGAGLCFTYGLILYTTWFGVKPNLTPIPNGGYAIPNVGYGRYANHGWWTIAQYYEHVNLLQAALNWVGCGIVLIMSSFFLYPFPRFGSPAIRRARVARYLVHKWSILSIRIKSVKSWKRIAVGISGVVVFILPLLCYLLSWYAVVDRLLALNPSEIALVEQLSYGNNRLQDIYFLSLLVVMLACLCFSTGSIRRTIQFGSAILMVLPFGVLLFDRREFSFYFTNTIVKYYLPWLTNEVLLFLCVGLVVITTIWPRVSSALRS